jgi:hypothetical protein
MVLRLLAGLSSQRPWFKPMPDHVGFMTDELVLAYDFLLALRYFLVTTILHTCVVYVTMKEFLF